MAGWHSDRYINKNDITLTSEQGAKVKFPAETIFNRWDEDGGEIKLRQEGWGHPLYEISSGQLDSNFEVDRKARYTGKAESNVDKAFSMQFRYGYDIEGYRFTMYAEAKRYLKNSVGLTEEEAIEYLVALEKAYESKRDSHKYRLS
jgi:hypothetical protein